MLRPRGEVARATLDLFELHACGDDGRAAFDLVVSHVTPRRGHGAPYLDVGALSGPASEIVAQSSRIDRVGVLPKSTQLALPHRGRWQRRWDGNDGVPVAIDLELSPLAHRAGVMVARGSGTIAALGRTTTFQDQLLLVSERRVPRRPYAWARALLTGEIDGRPIACTVDMARSRAGSVVLPELGRLRFFGTGRQSLPRACVLAPMPVRAEYGTGRLKAAVLVFGHKLELTLEAPPTATALFEVVDPNGDAAYAHRALEATCRLVISKRQRVVADLRLHGRYEWGARAGDPRVPHKAWRG